MKKGAVDYSTTPFFHIPVTDRRWSTALPAW
jgi:hypothetical protein